MQRLLHPVGCRPSCIYPWMVLIGVALSTIACALSSPETLNDGKGTRENPVPPRTYARTVNYDVRALNVVWEQQNESTSSESLEIPLRVQYQIRCTKDEGDVCQLEDIHPNLKLVDTNGIVYESVFLADLEKPLQGEVLGDGEKVGWIAYRVPRGVEITAAVAEYGAEQHVFFELP
ncbi:MAG: DUF4352 domain-containing protein [Chloroflexi bacterium]|nr:DUF4352 domain-containing protein [Chloroflexota bacterium]